MEWNEGLCGFRASRRVFSFERHVSLGSAGLARWYIRDYMDRLDLLVLPRTAVAQLMCNVFKQVKW